MPLDKIDARIINKFSTESGATPYLYTTVGLTSDFTSWNRSYKNAILSGEHYYNLKDERFFVGTLTGVTELLTVTSANNVLSGLTNFVHLSGDTMTGKLTTPSLSSTTIQTDYIDFNTNISVPTHTEGRLYYNNQEKALTYQTDSTGTSIQIGQESVIRVTNKTGAKILNGSVVKIEGAQGTRPKIILASCSATTADNVIGVCTQDFEINDIGYVTTEGIVRDLNTSLYNEGDVIWLSITPGEFTKTRPTSLNSHSVKIGYVTYSHINQGEILVSIQNFFKLEELDNIDRKLSAATNYDLLQYSGASQTWVASKNLSASTISATTLYSGSTDLSTIIDNSIVNASYWLRTGTTTYLKNSGDTVLVNGKINIYDGTGQTVNGGIATEVYGLVLNYGINNGTSNLFGGSYNSSYSGGYIRFDTRSNNFFQWLARDVGATGLSNTVMTLTTQGTLTVGEKTSSNLNVKATGNGIETLSLYDNTTHKHMFFYGDNTSHGGIQRIYNTTTGVGTQLVGTSTGGQYTYFNSGNIGIGTITPSTDLSFGGDADRTIGLERNSITTGKNLIIEAGGAKAGSLNTYGGSLILRAGKNTGNGYVSNIIFQGTTYTSVTGTTDNDNTYAIAQFQTSGGYSKLFMQGGAPIVSTSGVDATLIGNNHLFLLSSRVVVGYLGKFVDLGGYTNSGEFNVMLPNDADKSLGIVRQSSTNGKNFTISAGGAVASGTNLNGGNLILKSGIATGNGTSRIKFYTVTAGISGTGDTLPTEKMTILGSGNVGIGTTTPSYDLSFGSAIERTIGAERNSSNITSANSFNLIGVGGYVGGTNKNGGNLNLKSGISTGNGTSDIKFFTSGGGATGTTDVTPVERMAVLGNGQVRIGTATDNTTFEIDGTMTMNGSATTYNDISYTMAIERVGATTSLDTLISQFRAYTLDIAANDFLEYATVEIPHSWIDGTSQLDFHVHWCSGNETLAAVRYVKFEIDILVANMSLNGTTAVVPGASGITFGTVYQATGETTMAIGTAPYTHFYTELSRPLPLNAFKYGSQMKLLLKRVTASGTAPSQKPFILQVGQHYEMNRLGTRTEYA